VSFRIKLEPFGVEFDCAEEDTVLEAAFKAGISLRHGCKHGGCGACKVQVIDGYVEYAKDPTSISEAEEDAGIALLCCALPEEDLVIQLDDDYSATELVPEFPVCERQMVLANLSWVTHDISHLRLEPADGDNSFGFRPGQYIEIARAGSDQWRAFSMANAPAVGSAQELLVKQIPSGCFSGYLKDEAKIGDALQIRGPYGQFGIADTAAPMIMIAGGSGMAPIMSMLGQLAVEQSRREIQFFYGARAARDLFWLDQIASLGARLPSFEFIPALSEPDEESDWQGEVGLITDVVARRTADSLRGSEGYLCGPPGMIDAAVDTLKAKGMFSTRIRFDKFLNTSA
jgi:ferredoxin-NADP reductase/ferredoxin